MTSEADAFLKKFWLRVVALSERLKKAAGIDDGPTTQGDLDILAAASMELLTLAIANMPEPMRSERLRGLSETLAIDVAKKRERLEQKIPNRRLDTPQGSA